MVLYDLPSTLGNVDVRNWFDLLLKGINVFFLPVKVISNFVCSGRRLLTNFFIDLNKLEPLSPSYGNIKWKRLSLLLETS